MSQTKRDPYDTIDMRVSLHAENWSVTAWGRNITGEDYLAEVIPGPEYWCRDIVTFELFEVNECAIH